MQMPWQSIQGFSGATAVGALTLVGIILIANVFAMNLFPAIDFYAQTATWAIVVAVPVVAFSYLLGLLTNGAAEVVLVWFHLVQRDDLIHDPIAASVRGDFVAGRFQQLRQEAELLAGSSIALALLSVGAALSAWVAEGWRTFLASVAVTAIILALGSFFLGKIRHASAHSLALAANFQKEATCAE